jgi:hypothetical protein
MVPSLRLLGSSQTQGLCRLGKSPLFSPFGLSKHLKRGSVRTRHQLLTTQMEPWGFIKPLMQTYTVLMELSLRLSFQLRPSLGGYMVGTTVGFRLVTMDGLAPWTHLRFPRWYPQYHMNTYSASHRVNGSSHPLNRMLGGYYRGHVPGVLWVTSYSSAIWI